MRISARRGDGYGVNPPSSPPVGSPDRRRGTEMMQRIRVRMTGRIPLRLEGLGTAQARGARWQREVPTPGAA